jgi:hypothetical protein
MSTDAILEAATRFRLAIETTEKSLLSPGFRRFPWGACGDASVLLGKFLKDQGLGDFTLVVGHAADIQHAWLEQDNVMVDITADQFDAFVGVIHVGDDIWRRHFAERRQCGAASQHVDNGSGSELAGDYRLLADRALFSV